MTDDLVKRLRDAEVTYSGSSINNGCAGCGVDANTCAEAAAEIERLRAELSRRAPIGPEAWQPIETAPKDGALLLYFGKRVWHDGKGSPVSLGPVRDLAERVEAGFVADGFLCESGTGHAFIEEEDWLGPENLPTHWKPLNPPALHTGEGET